MAKKALITGITGQDGSYLAELLLSKNYEVHGIIRRASTFNTSRIDHLFLDPHKRGVKMFLHYGDLTDSSNLNRVLSAVAPDEIYHLGAQSHVRVSFDMPEYTGNVSGLGTVRILDAMREVGLTKTRFYQASSSEMFGNVKKLPINEATPLHPRSPYGIAKVYAYWITINYRESYGLFASNGVLFNHESPRRGETFVSRKVTRGLSRVKLGCDEKLYLGNLEASRDWGHAADYVEGMWRMLQHTKPDDFVLATGEAHSVRELVEEAGRCLGMEIEWHGSGQKETGVDRISGKTVIAIDPRYFRPAEIDVLIGDARKARKELGWKPTHTFKTLIEEMVTSDLEHEKRR